jgi:hypothetical protein
MKNLQEQTTEDEMKSELKAISDANEQLLLLE